VGWGGGGGQLIYALGLVFFVAVHATFDTAIARRRLREGMRAVSYEPAPAPAPAKANLPLQPPAVLFNDDCPICLDR
jgi:hypothetical protein